MARSLILLLVSVVVSQAVRNEPLLTESVQSRAVSLLAGFVTPQSGHYGNVSTECQRAGDAYIAGLNQGNLSRPSPSLNSLAMLDAGFNYPPAGYVSDANVIHFPGSFTGCLEVLEDGARDAGQYCLLTVLDYGSWSDLTSNAKNAREPKETVTNVAKPHWTIAHNEHFIPDRPLLENIMIQSTDETCPPKKPDLNFFGLLKVAKCIPTSCSDEDIVMGSMNYFYQIQDLDLIGDILLPNFHKNSSFGSRDAVVALPLACHTRDETIAMTGGDITMITVVSFFGFLIAFSTWVDVGISVLDLPYLPKSLLPIFQGFSAYHNVIKIVSVSSGPSDGSNLACLNGLKYISITWILLGHVLWEYTLVSGHGAFVASLTADINSSGSTAFTAIWNGLLGVDTFFVIGGCLLAFHTLKEMDKAKGGSVGMWAMFYVHRCY